MNADLTLNNGASLLQVLFSDGTVATVKLGSDGSAEHVMSCRLFSGSPRLTPGQISAVTALTDSRLVVSSHTQSGSYLTTIALNRACHSTA